MAVGSISGTAKEATHYKESAAQPIEFMYNILTKEEFIGFLKGNIIKYRMRAKHKGKYEEDIQKANQYAYWLYIVRNNEEFTPVSVPNDFKYKGI